MTSKLSARQRELLTKMADGRWFLSGAATWPEWEWSFDLMPNLPVPPWTERLETESVNPWTVLRLKDLGYIKWNGGDVMGRFVIYALTDAGRAVVRELVNGEQGDE